MPRTSTPANLVFSQGPGTREAIGVTRMENNNVCVVDFEKAFRLLPSALASKLAGSHLALRGRCLGQKNRADSSTFNQLHFVNWIRGTNCNYSLVYLRTHCGDNHKFKMHLWRLSMGIGSSESETFHFVIL